MTRSQAQWQFVAALACLSWCVTLRYPATTTLADWLRPSLDVAVLLGLLALFATRPGWRPSRWLIGSLAAWLVAVRCGRIADGICQHYLDRRFHLVSDLVLVPEFVRLSISVLGVGKAVFALLAFLIGIGLLCFVVVWALQLMAAMLSLPRLGDVYLLGFAALASISLGLAGDGASLFSSAVTPRMVSELELWLTARGLYDDPAQRTQRQRFTQLFQERQARLAAQPASLRGLGGVDVHLILVEAYGHVVMSNPLYVQQLAPAYAELASALKAAGFHVCTDFERATVLGGNSWLTHATLETGVPIAEQFEYGLVMERESAQTLSRTFRAAGYRTVSVKPGTTRPAPQARIYGFDDDYAAWNFGYRGPTFGWAPMPDQFVLEFVAARELRRRSQRPLFLEYALISTHFPFTPRPLFIQRGQLGDGSAFRSLPAIQHDEWQGELNPYAVAYLDSLRYELQVLSDFVTHDIAGDALVLILGDHGPVSTVIGVDPSHSTPMHVLSRRAELLEPFRARGCEPGLFSQRPEPHRRMEDLASELLSDFEAPRAAP